MAGDITTEPKQDRQAGPMSSLCILLCLCVILSVDKLGVLASFLHQKYGTNCCIDFFSVLAFF